MIKGIAKFAFACVGIVCVGYFLSKIGGVPAWAVVLCQVVVVVIIMRGGSK